MKTIRIGTSEVIAEINVHGAELVSLSKPGMPSILWSKQTEHWNRISPNLFPIVGRLKDDTYYFNNDRYELGQHGFARDMDFEVESQKDNSITLKLQSNERTIVRYPFLFEFRVTFHVSKNILKVTYDTSNIGDKEMYYSVGGHPAFYLEDQWESYRLTFESGNSCVQSLLHGSYFSGEEKRLDLSNGLTLNAEMFHQDAIVFKNPSFQSMTLFKADSPILTFKGEWESFALWSKPGAPFLCLEPWWGYADDVETPQQLDAKAGIRKLSKSQRELVSYSIELL